MSRAEVKRSRNKNSERNLLAAIQAGLKNSFKLANVNDSSVTKDYKRLDDGKSWKLRHLYRLSGLAISF